MDSYVIIRKLNKDDVNYLAKIWTSSIYIGGIARYLKDDEYLVLNVSKGNSAVLIPITVYENVDTRY